MWNLNSVWTCPVIQAEAKMIHEITAYNVRIGEEIMEDRIHDAWLERLKREDDMIDACMFGAYS